MLQMKLFFQAQLSWLSNIQHRLSADSRRTFERVPSKRKIESVSKCVKFTLEEE